MNKNSQKILLLILIILSAIIGTSCFNETTYDIDTIPGLPQPIAKEPVLITSAGQSTDTYIIKDIANELMIHNFFMPQAKEKDLENIKTIVFVVSYSSIGEKLHDTNFEKEKDRIEKLLKKADHMNLTIITIFAGGKQQRVPKADELLCLIIPYSDYLIATKEANSDLMLSNQANNNNIPLTLVKEVRDITEPFASSFR